VFDVWRHAALVDEKKKSLLEVWVAKQGVWEMWRYEPWVGGKRAFDLWRHEVLVSGKEVTLLALHFVCMDVRAVEKVR
jgi:hypothetical protein